MKRLYKIEQGKKIAGVCGGIADGMTLFDTRHFTDLPKNCYVCLDTDEEKFAGMMVDILSRAK